LRIVFLGEILSLRGYAGAALMLASLMLIELKPDFRKVVSR